MTVLQKSLFENSLPVKSPNGHISMERVMRKTKKEKVHFHHRILWFIHCDLRLSVCVIVVDNVFSLHTQKNSLKSTKYREN